MQKKIYKRVLKKGWGVLVAIPYNTAYQKKKTNLFIKTIYTYLHILLLLGLTTIGQKLKNILHGTIKDYTDNIGWGGTYITLVSGPHYLTFKFHTETCKNVF